MGVKRKTEDSAVISWESPPDVDVDNYEFQVFINGQPIDTWQLTPYPQAVIPVASNATVSIILRSIDKAMNRSANTNKTGRLNNMSVPEKSIFGKADLADCPKGKSPCGKFDRRKAGLYARYWANGINTIYGEAANDCANFVSQALHDGGVEFMREYRHGVDSWWIQYVFPGPLPKGNTATESWVNAESLYKQLLFTGVARPLTNKEFAQEGDVIFFDWYTDRGKGSIDHVGIIASDGSDPLYASHEKPRLLPWSYQLKNIDDYLRYRKAKDRRLGKSWMYYLLRPVHSKANTRDAF